MAPEVIAAARKGEWSVVLTPRKPVPREWFGELKGQEVLGLASAGGQQGPVLAAAGARVTILDNSPAQLAQDRLVAEREGLSIRLVEGDMREMPVFPDESFDLISTRAPTASWMTCGACGARPTACCGPEACCCPGSATRSCSCSIRNWSAGEIPDQVPDAILGLHQPHRRGAPPLHGKGEPLCVAHSLEDQIGGQLAAGFVVTGFYEDKHVEGDQLSEYMSLLCATRAVKSAK